MCRIVILGLWVSHHTRTVYVRSDYFLMLVLPLPLLDMSSVVRLLVDDISVDCLGQPHPFEPSLETSYSSKLLSCKL